MLVGHISAKRTVHHHETLSPPFDPQGFDKLDIFLTDMRDILTLGSSSSITFRQIQGWFYTWEKCFSTFTWGEFLGISPIIHRVFQFVACILGV